MVLALMGFIGNLPARLKAGCRRALTSIPALTRSLRRRGHSLPKDRTRKPAKRRKHSNHSCNVTHAGVSTRLPLEAPASLKRKPATASDSRPGRPQIRDWGSLVVRYQLRWLARDLSPHRIEGVAISG
jgi:hypothetical protein